MNKLKNIKVILIDLSGTIHIDDTSIKGSVEAIERLRKTNLKFIFATNTTKESKYCLLQKLKNLNFNIHSNEIFTSLIAARNLVEKKKLKPYLALEETAKEDLKDVCDINLKIEDSDSIIIGYAPNKLNFKDMNSMFKSLILKKKILIGIHKSRYFQTKNGLKIGPGGFIEALENAADQKAIIVGKPQEEFFRQAINNCYENLSYTNVAMIGDDIKDDVLSAQKLGITGILVKTGKYKENDENKYEMKPNFVFDSIVEAINTIISIQEN